MKGDAGWKTDGWDDAKWSVFTLILVKIGEVWAIKKPRQAWGLAVALRDVEKRD